MAHPSNHFSYVFGVLGVLLRSFCVPVPLYTVAAFAPALQGSGNRKGRHIGIHTPAWLALYEIPASPIFVYIGLFAACTAF